MSFRSGFGQGSPTSNAWPALGCFRRLGEDEAAVEVGESLEDEADLPLGGYEALNPFGRTPTFESVITLSQETAMVRAIRVS